MSKAKLLVSEQLLVEALRLPEGTEILTAEATFDDILFERVAFLISHPDIPEGAQDVTSEYVTHYDEQGNITKIEFTGWRSV